VHEEGVIRARADDAHLDAVLRVPAGEAVEAVEPLTRIEIIMGAQCLDFFTGQRLRPISNTQLTLPKKIELDY
jgi:hypothetical protein